MASHQRELPRRPSRSHLPSARSVDCLSNAHQRAFTLGFEKSSWAITNENDSPPSALPRRSQSRTSFQELQKQFNETQQFASAGVPTRTPGKATTMVINFEAKVETYFGDTAVLVGSATEFGSWQPTSGVRMATNESSYPVWKAQVTVSALSCNTGALEYKVVIIRADGSIHWEGLEHNRRLTLRTGREARLGLTWDTPIATESVAPEVDTQPAAAAVAAVPPQPPPPAAAALPDVSATLSTTAAMIIPPIAKIEEVVPTFAKAPPAKNSFSINPHNNMQNPQKAANGLFDPARCMKLLAAMPPPPQTSMCSFAGSPQASSTSCAGA